MCFVNSSFVGWQDNNGEQIFDDLWNKQEYAFHMYASLDKYMFYEQWHKKSFDHSSYDFLSILNKEIMNRYRIPS